MFICYYLSLYVLRLLRNDVQDSNFFLQNNPQR